jgi:hypothetical protein
MASHAMHPVPITQSRTGEAGGGKASGGADALAVVVKVTVAFAESLPSSATDDGETVHVAPAGAPLQFHITVPTKPEAGVAVIVKLVCCPAVSVALVGDAETL